MTSPAASSGGVGLNVEPDLSIVGVSHSGNEVVHLCGRALPSAGEHVDIYVGHTAVPGC